MDKAAIRRSAAFLLDMVLISILYTGVINFIPETIFTQQVNLGSRSLTWSFDLYGFLTAAYFIGCDLGNRGESLGKDIFHLKTVRQDGAALDYQMSLARTLLKLISISMLPFAALLYVWKGREFTLQDFLVGSRVRPQRKLKAA